MKIVIAPDSFKECLSAAAVASAMAEGVVAACGEASVDVCPMADGGEGTVDAVVVATSGQFLAADVYDPLGKPIRARFGLLGTPPGPALPGEVGLQGAAVTAEGEGTAAEGLAGKTAIIEMAAASGLALVPPEYRDPMRTTTFGTGQLILAALDAGAARIILGIGGSATVDGGCGCAQALGVVFTGADGEPAVCGLAGGGLHLIEDIDMSDRDPRLAEAEICVASDVTNPLTGPAGAATVYGPQKGATAETVELLDAGLAHLAKVIRRRLALDVAGLPGAGAAGGLGGGLVAFAGAKLDSGFDIVARAVHLRRRLTDADLCLTGEGRLDSQSRHGKTAVGVAKAAQQAHVPIICIPGEATIDAPRSVFADVRPLAAGFVSPRQAMLQAAELLKARTEEAVRDFLRKR